MKFTQVRAFEKHLKEAFPSHLASLYLIVDPDLYAQRKWAKKIHFFKASAEVYSAVDLTKGKLAELFQSLGLFESHRQIVLLEVDKVPKTLWEAILKGLSALSPHLQLILTASSLTAPLQKILKETVTLDLSKEKPWDKEKRLTDYVTEAFKQAHLKISSALALELVKQSAFQLAAMDQDIEKLICFLKGAKEVKREDFSLIQPQSKPSVFKVGEALLSHRLSEALTLIHQEGMQAIPLIYALRSLFQRTLRLKELSKPAALKAFPRFNEKWLDKMQREAANHSKSSLEKALIQLFELEVMLKNQTTGEHLASSLCVLKLGELL